VARHLTDLDYSTEQFNAEAVDIARATEGAFSRSDLLKMRWDDYQTLIDIINRRITEENNRNEKK